MDSETGQESDLEVILEDDDLSESDQALTKSKMRAEEQELFEGLDRESMHEKFEETMKLNRVIYEGAGDEPVTVDTYKPFPPFRIPDQVKLPPGLQKWKFEDGVAVPDDTDSKHT
ncbi:hypothetical protein GGI07_001309 [Coemansia sp. Benny D115]|nr:hypothetical protein GGI07_001309 [Coemansia sp. Benny D115]